MAMENVHTHRGHLPILARSETMIHIMLGTVGLTLFGSAVLLATRAYYPSCLFGIALSTILVIAASVGGDAEEGEGLTMTVALVAILLLIWSFVWFASGLIVRIF